MAGIWTSTGSDWKPAAPQPFPDERALQEMVAKHPHLLPLAGSPQLIVLGLEVRLGNGKVDVLAVEASGRPAIIEVKLARNPEARRAVVSQILAYAASLQGHDLDSLEQGPLQEPLRKIGYESLAEAVKGQDQESAVDYGDFRASFQEHLNNGQFRLVLVLDDVSSELESIVGYLDTVTIPGLTTDLVTVTVFTVGGVQVALPQRISPDSDRAAATAQRPTKLKSKARTFDGPGAFAESMSSVSEEDHETFEQLIAWADDLVRLPNVRLFSSISPTGGVSKLQPRLTADNAGLVSIANNSGKLYIQFWRHKFESLAPNSINEIERLIAPKEIGQGNEVTEITPELLAALKQAYEEAVAPQS